jgi:hypothetical protein
MSHASGVLPLGMLPARTVEAPKKTTLGNRIIYEFPVIGAVALADDLPWSPIVLSRAGKSVRFLKPTSGQTGVEVKGLLTDQHIDFRYSLFTLETDLYPEHECLQTLELYPIVNEMIHLLRTVARQYWIGLAMANEGSVVQGIRTRIESGIASFAGQGSYSVPFVVSPLDQQSWQFLGELLAMQAFPSTGEVILCDALLEIRRADLLQAILLLGVACEVELASLLDELISSQKVSRTKRDEILSSPFKMKLLNRTVELGTVSPETATIPRFPPDWAHTVCDLYRLRNQAAHGGHCTIEDKGVKRAAQLGDLARFLFSAEALFAWINQERIRLGFPRCVTATNFPKGYPISAMIFPGQI